MSKVIENKHNAKLCIEKVKNIYEQDILDSTLNKKSTGMSFYMTNINL